MDTPVRTFHIHQQLQEGTDADFIHPDIANPRLYVFKNTQFRQVVYSRMLFSQRSALHLEIANYYEHLVNTKIDHAEGFCIIMSYEYAN